MLRLIIIPIVFLFQFGFSQIDAGVTSVTEPSGNICPISFQPLITIENFGSTTITSLDVLYNIDGAANATYAWSGNLPSGTTVDITLPSMNTTVGAHIFNASTSTPNGLTDSNTSNDANSSNFTVTPSINYTANVTNTTCGSTVGSIVINATGGTGTLQYSIDGGVTFQASNTFTNLDLGSYDIVIEDANGCQKLGIENVLSNGGPAIVVATGQDPTCHNGTDGTIVISATGSGLTYSVDGGVTYQSLAFFQNLSAGTYSVYVKDNAGCLTFDLVTLDNPQKINTLIFGNNASCNGTNGSTSVLASGGDGNFSYSWDDPANQQSSSASGLAAGFYHVTVTDGGGCEVLDSVFINNTGGPSVSLAATNSLCYNDPSGQITASVGGGTAPYTYSWNDAAQQTTQTATNLLSGNYLVQVTDNNGCKAYGVALVGEPDELTNTISSIQTTCGYNNGVIITNAFGGTAPYSYLWDDANSQTNSTATNLSPGNYSVIITDDNGCTLSAVEDIFASDSLSVSSIITNASCSGIADGGIEIAITGGTTPYSINWSTGDTTLILENILGNTYDVEISDADGCSINKVITVINESNDCLIIPTAISPNGDGKNDAWIIEGIDLAAENKVEIYNRWGALLYNSDSYQNDWEGTTKGKNLPAGGYFYIVTIMDKSYSGPIAIIR